MAVGGGGWSFGWGPQDDADSLATMRHALELGVNWIDTAAVYGLGHSEELVGRLVRELPPAQRSELLRDYCDLQLTLAPAPVRSIGRVAASA